MRDDGQTGAQAGAGGASVATDPTDTMSDRRKIGLALVVACALFITFDVVGRALLGVSSAATVEITGYMLAIGIAWGLAHALARRAHIRVDVWVSRLPIGIRSWLHLLSLLLLGAFAAFCAWAALSLVDESLLFDAHDNSALRVPLVMEGGREFVVPTEAKTGWNWGDFDPWTKADFLAGKCREDQIGQALDIAAGVRLGQAGESRCGHGPDAGSQQ